MSVVKDHCRERRRETLMSAMQQSVFFIDIAEASEERQNCTAAPGGYLVTE
jgi:hypothetical protein